MQLPEIVYVQTHTLCDGHCRYCPHDDVYGAGEARQLSAGAFAQLLVWLREEGFGRKGGRLGLFLQCEPTLDERLESWIRWARYEVPGVRVELATNGLHQDAPALEFADEVVCVPAGTRTWGTSRAGNARACPENVGRRTFEQPCPLPEKTLSVAATGEVLLCCQDWRHEAVVGTTADLTAARLRQLELAPLVKSLKLEICRDCAAGRTAEEVGERLGKRTPKVIP